MSITRAIRSRIERRIPPKVANFWCHVTEGAFVSFGSEMVGAQLFAVLVVALGGGRGTLGILASIGSFAVIAPLIFAPRIEAARRKKRLVLLLGLGQRLPQLLIVLALMLLARGRPLVCLYAIALIKLLGAFATSLLWAPWQDLIAETVPIRRVGRLFGFRNFLAGVMRVPSAGVCAAIIVLFAFPANYQLLYLLSFGIGMVSWAIFALVDEMPEAAAPRARQPAGHYFRNLIAALRDDRNYRRYLLYFVFNKSPDVVVVFFALAALDVHHMQKASWLVLSGAAAGAAAIGGNLLLPFVAERVGPKRMLGGALCLRAAAMLLAAVAPTGMWLVAALFLLGLCGAGQAVAGPPLMMRVFPRGKRVGYITLSSVAMAPLRIVIPLLAGLVSKLFGFGVLFAATGGWLLLGLIPLRRIELGPEPAGDGPRPDEPVRG